MEFVDSTGENLIHCFNVHLKFARKFMDEQSNK